MPEIKIPLVGSPDLRNSDAAATIDKGQRFIGCVFDVVKNPVTGNGRVYASKRNGVQTIEAAVSAADAGVAISDDGRVAIFDSTNHTVYYRNSASAERNCGDIGNGGVYKHIVTAFLNTEKVWLISGTNNAWFLAKGAADVSSPTFTATAAAGNATLTSVSSFTGLYVGQRLSMPTGVTSNQRIASMDTGASTITMTANADGNSVGGTVTFDRLAKIIDADFPSQITGGFVEIDGYAFIGRALTQQIFNSDQDSIVSWNAAGYLSLNSTSGDIACVAKHKGRLVGLGDKGYEFFYNAGNTAPASPFTRTGDSGDAGCFLNEQSSKLAAFNSGNVYFVSNNLEVCKLVGGDVQVVSTPTVTALLQDAMSSVGPGVAIYDIHFRGRNYIIVNDPLFDLFSLGYDPDLNLWFETGHPVGLRYAGLNIDIDSIYAPGERTVFVSSSKTDGDIYGMNAATPVYQDYGGAYTMTIQTAGLDLDSGNRKTVEFYELDSDVQSSGTATLKVCDDDSGTFTTVGTFDMTKVNPRIYRGGSWKGKRQFQITHSDNTAFRASQLRIKFTVGAH